ncbi:MAG TPA: 1,4-alpha-glucan branching protein GlgB [Gordonia sp. (in: high G+C Gram-positive bacteria)]|uniref:1,4-alpha-glucan branching protein GlgB n=1 Tax=unclassified Gordonia (in: high G+C Gram-positive bacteria) TaxID=2657482 RepID=UPI000FBA8C23|nr:MULTISPECIES: 1,4-alpha-glucan branching protein GlgB [unclassified Gordonia (in: high G+C Gram-positive bacteria)]RUP40886.1 MAG: 1,4-alpha-glucan branching protein GlgB [Gordonia sp. (in: high G+C Gram-positive bacteria)]HNP57708.1 1,4-alpha-glucan branching protein GlgB [Gordonia sp. (in: high G+C Gram-positive bacteria)]HRC51313.1 1,4-alpha-glucan branching protein GlgB [Gordonia sp. (in: high G+C Gram-positive bacteria)]
MTGPVVDPRLPARLADDLFGGRHSNPHALLGAHRLSERTVAFRVLRPQADGVTVVLGGNDGTPTSEHPMAEQAPGLWVVAVAIPSAATIPDYRYRVRYPADRAHNRADRAQESVDRAFTVADPYRFGPSIGDDELALVTAGQHRRLWEVLGAHVRTRDTPSGPVTGVAFSVWAPQARGVTVIGDFEGWEGRLAPMRKLPNSGVWEVFLPEVRAGELYKYRVHGADGTVVDKADPMARATETPPATASVIVDDGQYPWGDAAWLRHRGRAAALSEPMSIYEVHLASWRPGLGYRELAVELADYVTAMGFTHVELLPVAEHPYGGSWGYQVSSYFAPTARLGGPDDFRFLVDSLHRRGIGVLVDWVPAHFPRDAWALARFDGTPTYEHPDPQRADHPDWGTLIFDYGRREVAGFLISNALYWLDEFHLDGLRVDAVASMLYLDYSRGPGQWTPNIHGGLENLEAMALLRELNSTVHDAHPGVLTIAEESTSWPGVTRDIAASGLGFSLKWNMGWMHDTLGFLQRDIADRAFHHHQITFSLMYAFNEQFVLPLSHDEVVHEKGTLWTRMPGDADEKARAVRLFLAYQWCHPGKPLLFMGQEFGQTAEWADNRGVDWHELDDGPDADLHQGIAQLVVDLNALTRTRPALYARDTTPDGYEWISVGDASSPVFGFCRHADGATMVCLFNVAPDPFAEYRVGMPERGRWRVVLDSDDGRYTGRTTTDAGSPVYETAEIPWQGRASSIALPLAANTSIWLELT